MPVLAGVAVVLLAGAGVMTYLGWLPTHSAPGTSVVHSTRPELTGATVPCGRCGRVEAVREISSGHGVSNRTLTGATLAQHLGGFSSVTNVLGLLVVAVTGSPADHETNRPAIYQTTVRFDDGSARMVTEVNPPLRKPGDIVKVVSGRIFPVLEPEPDPVVDSSR